MAKVWRGSELAKTAGFLVEFSTAERAELCDAASASAGLDEHAARVLAETSDLLTAVIRRIAEALEAGPGACHVRGLCDESIGEEELERLVWLLSLSLGTPLSQSVQGDKILRVCDHGLAEDDPRFRGPHSKRQLAFHSDRCDTIVFACVRSAVSGGENDLICSRALYEAIRAVDPAAIEVLGESFPYLRHSIDGANARPFTQMPVFAERDGYFHASLLRVLIDRADRDPRAPDLSEAQRSALNTLESVAEDPQLYYRLRLARGDLLLLNNWQVLHRRLAFVDAFAAAERRLLLRVWLSSKHNRGIDPRYREHFGAVDEGVVRGGIQAFSDR